MSALGMFDATADDGALMTPHAVRWMTIVLSLLNVALGGSTVAVGISNSTNVRVEEAKATVATAMQSAIEATPGDPNAKGP